MLNKIISLAMSVIMLITASPVLQAADFSTNLNIAELNELREEISASLPEPKGLKTKKIIYDGLPNIEAIKKRYAQARANYEQNLQKFANQETKQDEEDYDRYIEFLKSEARQRVKQDSRYNGFRTEKEAEQVAFYTVLLEENKKSNEERKHYRDCTMMNISVGSLVGVIVFGLAEHLAPYSPYVASRSIVGPIISGCISAAVVISIMFLLNSPSKPVFNPSMFSEELISEFLSNPFRNLSLFDKRASDSEMFYNKSKDCAQILNDAVDIEYYISLNMSVENMQARLYTQTIDWHYLTTEERADYIHNLAEHLRAEAK